jgi:hypothetical protein
LSLKRRIAVWLLKHDQKHTSCIVADHPIEMRALEIVVGHTWIYGTLTVINPEVHGPDWGGYDAQSDVLRAMTGARTIADGDKE